MPYRNQLAPPSSNRLGDEVPSLDPMLMPPPYTPPQSLSGRLENLSIGLGYGKARGLEGLYQMVTQPRATAQAIAQFAREVSDDPGVVLEMLRQARQKAMSGELGLGELIGENVSARNLLRRDVPTQRIKEPEDFMTRRDRQLVEEENVESTQLANYFNAQTHLDNLYAIRQNEAWINQTGRRAEVVARLKELGAPVDLSTGLNRWQDISNNLGQIENPFNAYNAKILIERNRKDIDEDFDRYIAGIREYRRKLNPRSKYDRQMIKDIDAILGDIRVTQLKPE